LAAASSISYACHDRRARPAFPTRRSSDLVVDEAPQADQRHLVAAVDGGAREPDGGVVVLLGGHVVDHEAELDRFHWAGSFWKRLDRKSTRLNSSHVKISYAVFCLKKKTET